MNRREEHFAAVSKIAAVRQKRARQRGVKLGYGQHAWSGSAIRLVSEALPIGTSDFSIEYYGNTYGSASASYGTLFNKAQPNIYQEGCFTMYSGLAGRNGVVWVLFAGSADDGVNLNYLPADPQERFHLIVTRSGKTVKVYINGVLHTAKEQSEVKNFPTFQLGLANSSDAVFARVYDYALSAEEAAALWNGGDPAGYVLPVRFKYRDMSYRSDFSRDADAWEAREGSGTSLTHADNALQITGDKPLYQIWRFGPKIPEHLSAYRVEVAFSGPLPEGVRVQSFAFSSQMSAYLTLSEDRTRATGVVGVTLPDSRPSRYIYLYFRVPTPGLSFAITSVAVTPVGCRAEYLPQNIVPAAQGDVAGAWLDSAAQKPFDGAYLPPLLETAGGADMTAAGTPEILYPESNLWYGIQWDTTVSSSACTRIGDLSLHRQLPIQSRMRGCLLDDNGGVVEYLDPADWTGQTRDGSRGQVMVEIPAHFRKFETEGTIRRCKLSNYPLPGYHAVPKMYISAYEAVMERSTGKLCSVVNAGTDYRGGNNRADWDGTYRSLLGRPATVKSRTSFRNAARLRNASATAEWNCLDYNAYKAVFWLYYVEYANRNCQLAFNARKDMDGFAQGGLGNGVTDTPDWPGFNGYYPFVPCGYTDALGNASGEAAYVMTKEDGSTHGTVMVPRYRGIENPFGHLWKWCDGINILIASEADGGTSKVYVSDDPAKYSDSDLTGYTLRGLEARAKGYVKELVFGGFGEIIPAVTVGGGPATYFCDYYYTNVPASGTALRGILFGSNADAGASAGFSAAHARFDPSTVHAYFGSRLCFIPEK